MATKRLVILRTIIVVLVLFILFLGWVVSLQVRRLVDVQDETRISVAPAATPTERPWLELAGTDVWGRSNREPDKARLLRALHKRKFTELTTWLEQWQAEFEADPKQELWPSLSIGAFAITDPRLDPLLDAWVQASPDSWAPLAARGVYRAARARQARGTEYAAKTNASQFALMADWNRKAIEDLRGALVMKPTLVEVHERLLWISKLASDEDGIEAHYAAAVAQCPTCAGPHFGYADTLVARWGGSDDELRAFADKLRPKFAAIPMLVLLDGLVDADHCNLLWHAKKYADAKKACDAALRRGPDLDALFDRAAISAHLEDREAALADYDRILAIAPQHVDALVGRALLTVDWKQPEQGARDLTTALRINPDATSRNNYLWAVYQLLVEGDARWEADDIQGARALYDLAVNLSTEHEDARKRRAKLMYDHGVTDDEVAFVRKRWEAEFPSFSAARDLDDVLFARDELDEIVKVWDREIAANPKDGRLYYERGGTLHHLGRAEESEGDVRTACRLGFKRACRRLD